jgi:hypothetical protein
MDKVQKYNSFNTEEYRCTVCGVQYANWCDFPGGSPHP